MFSFTDQPSQFQYTQLSAHSYKLLLLLQQGPALSLGLKPYSAKLCTTKQRWPLLQGAYKPASTTYCPNVLCRSLSNGPLPHPDAPNHARERGILGLNPRGALPGQASDLTLGQLLPNCPSPHGAALLRVPSNHPKTHVRRDATAWHPKPRRASGLSGAQPRGGHRRQGLRAPLTCPSHQQAKPPQALGGSTGSGSLSEGRRGASLNPPRRQAEGGKAPRRENPEVRRGEARLHGEEKEAGVGRGTGRTTGVAGGGLHRRRTVTCLWRRGAAPAEASRCGVPGGGDCLSPPRRPGQVRAAFPPPSPGAEGKPPPAGPESARPWGNPRGRAGPGPA